LLDIIPQNANLVSLYFFIGLLWVLKKKFVLLTIQGKYLPHLLESKIIMKSILASAFISILGLSTLVPSANAVIIRANRQEYQDYCTRCGGVPMISPIGTLTCIGANGQFIFPPMRPGQQEIDLDVPFSKFKKEIIDGMSKGGGVVSAAIIFAPPAALFLASLQISILAHSALFEILDRIKLSSIEERFDSNYQIVKLPDNLFPSILIDPTGEITQEIANSMNKVLELEFKTVDFMRSTITAINRYDSALFVGDTFSADIQKLALDSYFDTFLQLSQEASMESLILRDLLADTSLNDIIITPLDFINYQALVATDGFPEEELQAIEDLNITSTELEYITERFVDLEPITEPIRLPESFRLISNGQAFNGNIPRTPEPTSTLGLFSLGILGVGATIKRQVKRNHSIEKETTKIG
jgi:hypothetical protein